MEEGAPRGAGEWGGTPPFWGSQWVGGVTRLETGSRGGDGDLTGAPGEAWGLGADPLRMGVPGGRGTGERRQVGRGWEGDEGGGGESPGSCSRRRRGTAVPPHASTLTGWVAMEMGCVASRCQQSLQKRGEQV